MKGIIFTGYNCNESCFFCSAEVHGRKEINRSLKDILQDIHRLSHGGYTEIEFIGGEVLIRADILLILTFAKKKGFASISVETNGAPLADLGFCEQVLKAGLNQITLSIHGAIAETNDRHTGLPGSFDAKISGLQNLQHLSQVYHISLATNYVLTSKNVGEVLEFIKHMDTFSCIQRYIFAFVRPLSSYKKMYAHYLPSFESIRSVFESFPFHLKVSIQYLPLCILSTPYREQYQSFFLKGGKDTTEKSNAVSDTIILEDAIQSEMTYLPGCTSCIHRHTCRGIWKEYVDFFGANSLAMTCVSLK